MDTVQVAGEVDDDLTPGLLRRLRQGLGRQGFEDGVGDLAATRGDRFAMIWRTGVRPARRSVVGVDQGASRSGTSA